VAKKWPTFGAAEALFQELRARRENELKLVLVFELDFESFARIADIGISHHPGPGKSEASFEATSANCFRASQTRL
jgi:hypothetical protein